MSCGQQEQLEEENGLNRFQTIRTDDNLGNKELTMLSDACRLLKSKDTYFRGNVINFNKVFDYKTSTKRCDEQDPTESEISLEVRQTGTNIKFVLASGNGDFFSDYESDQNGMIASFCKQRSTTAGSFNRFQVVGNTVTWLYVMENNTLYCPYNKNTVCLVLEMGQQRTDGKVQITDRHSLAVSKVTNNNLQGMVVGRMHESSSVCNEGFRKVYTELRL
jgi:hypothetical protein